ncbi:Hypothetical protein LOCK908_1945 [Lacticaseibacillus rhamnosus LOCK908]|nr:hypothetical protein LRHK_1885 [Lacticaseibacillus rhamnosus ATCC 8530]AGP74569.1 Hypothetical protein LOCK908_1945 [Lacticaseibacillus rhamnosus LOCK908]
MCSCKLANFRLTVVLAGMMSRTFLKGLFERLYFTDKNK